MDGLKGSLTEVTSLQGQINKVVQGGVTVTDDGNGNITINGINFNEDDGNVTVG